jgi:hypothetical protein
MSQEGRPRARTARNPDDVRPASATGDEQQPAEVPVPEETRRPARRSNRTTWLALLLLAIGLSSRLWLPLVLPARVESDAELAAADLKLVVAAESRVALVQGEHPPTLPWYAGRRARLPLKQLVKWTSPAALPDGLSSGIAEPGGGVLLLGGNSIVRINPAGQASRLAGVEPGMGFAQQPFTAAGDFLLTGYLDAVLHAHDGQVLWELHSNDMQDLDSLLGTALRAEDSSCLLAFGDSMYGPRHNSLFVEVPRGGLKQATQQQVHGLAAFSVGPDGRAYGLVSAEPDQPGTELHCYSAQRELLWTYHAAARAKQIRLTPLAGASVLLADEAPQGGNSPVVLIGGAGTPVWQAALGPLGKAAQRFKASSRLLWIDRSTPTQTELHGIDLAHGTPVFSGTIAQSSAGIEFVLSDDSVVLGVTGSQLSAVGMLQGLSCIDANGGQRWSLQTAEGLPPFEPCTYQGYIYVLGARTLYTFKQDGTSLKLWSIDDADAVKLLAAPEGVYLFLDNGDAMLLNSPP